MLDGKGAIRTGKRTTRPEKMFETTYMKVSTILSNWSSI